MAKNDNVNTSVSEKQASVESIKNEKIEVAKQDNIKPQNKKSGLIDEIGVAIENAYKELDHELAADLHSVHIKLVEMKFHVDELVKKGSKDLTIYLEKLINLLK